MPDEELCLQKVTLILMTEALELYGLAYGCPNEQRQDCCPFRPIDYLPFNDKVAWIESLSEGEIKVMIQEHKDCSVKLSLSNNFLNELL